MKKTSSNWQALCLVSSWAWEQRRTPWGHTPQAGGFCQGDAWTWPVTWKTLGQAAFSVNVNGIRKDLCVEMVWSAYASDAWSVTVVSAWSLASLLQLQSSPHRGQGVPVKENSRPCHSAEPSSSLHLIVWKAEVLTPTCDIWCDLFLFPSLVSPPYCSVCFSLTDPPCHSPHVQTHSCLKTFVLAILC